MNREQLLLMGNRILSKIRRLYSTKEERKHAFNIELDRLSKENNNLRHLLEYATSYYLCATKPNGEYYSFEEILEEISKEDSWSKENIEKRLNYDSEWIRKYDEEDKVWEENMQQMERWLQELTGTPIDRPLESSEKIQNDVKVTNSALLKLIQFIYQNKDGIITLSSKERIKLLYDEFKNKATEITQKYMFSGSAGYIYVETYQQTTVTLSEWMFEMESLKLGLEDEINRLCNGQKSMLF